MFSEPFFYTSQNLYVTQFIRNTIYTNRIYMYQSLYITEFITITPILYIQVNGPHV